MKWNEHLANGRFALYVSIALSWMLALAIASPAQINPKTAPDPNNNPPPANAIFDPSGTPVPGGGRINTYKQYTVAFQATQTSTAVSFAFREDPAFISFSNVSVTDQTTPGGNLLVNGDFSGGTYSVPPSGSNPGNPAVPNSWTYANQYGASAGGVVDPNCGVGPTGNYGVGNCWYDGAVQAYDLISQTITTVVGHTYQISFFVADNSGCNCNFSDVSTNGNTTGTGGNGINFTVYAQGGLPPAHDQCAAPTVGTGTGVVGSANGVNTCGLLIKVTQVDGNGNATTFTVTSSNPNGVPPNNGNPYDGTQDTLVGVQNNSGANLNSIPLTSSTTAFGFDGDGPCNPTYHTPAYPWCSNTGFTGYEGPVNTFTNISADHTSGTVSFTTAIPNGGSTWFALQGNPNSLTAPPMMQVQSTPPTNFTTTSTTTYTTVQTPFNTTAGRFNESDVSFAPTADLTFPPGSDPATMQLQTTNRCVSNSDQYDHDTPFATFKSFDVASNDALCGTPGNGAKYEVRCFDARNPIPSENDCPFASTPHTHIEHKVIIDSTGGTPPPINPGTTVAYLHWPIGPLVPGGPVLTATATSWSPSSGTGPGSNPNCTSVTNGMNGTLPFACDIENILITKYGGVNGPNSYAPSGSGYDKRKGDYFLGYNVPEPCSAWKVNGTPVHMPCVQGSSPFFVSSVLTGGLTFDFVVNPAQCPAGMLCGNGWTPAPIKNHFYHFDQCTSAGPDPCSSAPDYPNVVLLQLNEDLNDLATCFAGSSTCPVTGETQPGTSSTLPVKFTTTPPVPEPEGEFLLQGSGADAVQLRDLNIQLLNPGQGQCPDPFPNDPNRPVGGWVPPCYSTKLFNALVIVDNTKPKISSGPTLSAPGSPMVTVTYTCSDTDSPVPADNSGVALCGATAPGTMHNIHAPGGPGAGPSSVTEVDTLPSAIGSYSFTVQATDVAGNVSQPSQVNYTVYNICALYDQTKAVHSGATIPVKMYLCNSTGAVDLSSSSIVVHATGLLQLTLGTSDPVIDAGNANPDMDFRFDSTLGPSGGYIFNLKTTGLGTGNWVIQFTVAGDPTSHSLAFGVK
jgi:hypothetical protein